ncbi:MAG: methylglyoxal synthase [Prevotellaceae bacterium]|jgi:methylglyoxal synthase|nr:methylglyoxal synthase [Prevotellaceae bacterium]
MKKRKTIALVAHDNRKKDLVEWAEFNVAILTDYDMICTGTTGTLVETALRAKLSDDPEGKLHVTKLKSGPLGGDQQMGALICDGKIDYLIFLWDPMEPQPHDVDVKALLRIASVYNIPTATNRSTADFIISSPLMGSDYHPIIKNFSEYLNRVVGL